MFFRRSETRKSVKYIIVGAGEVGFHIAQRLAKENKNVVIIDKSQEKLRRVEEHLDVQTLLGSGSSPEILRQAGADEASVVLAVTDSDEINILVCLFANAIAPKAVKLARIRNAEYTACADLLDSTLNISMLVNPEEEVVRTIERLITLPGALEYGQFADGNIRMVAMRIEEGNLSGQPLKNFRHIVKDENIMVGAIARHEKLIIPSGNDVLEKGDVVYFIYTHTSQPTLLRVLNRKRGNIRSACIVGGGNIGVRLARLLESKGMDVRLIDKNEERCEALAAELDATMVLHGDGTDAALLHAEHIAKMDAFIAVTGDEESNILSCLLAKSLGVDETVTRINKVAYVPLAEAIGIRHSVSPRLSAVNSILQYIRRGRVLSSLSVGWEAAEIIEVLVAENTRLANSTPQELQLPRGALLIGVMREDKPFIPTGQTRLLVHDRVVILSLGHVISSVEKVISPKT